MIERKTTKQLWEQYFKNHMQKLIPDYIFAKLEIYICGLITIKPRFCWSWQFGSEFLLIISLWKLKFWIQKLKLKYKSIFWYPLKRIKILRIQMQLQNIEQQNQLWWGVWVGANLWSSSQGQKEQDSWCLTTLVLSNEVTHSSCCAS